MYVPICIGLKYTSNLMFKDSVWLWPHGLISNTMIYQNLLLPEGIAGVSPVYLSLAPTGAAKYLLCIRSGIHLQDLEWSTNEIWFNIV